MLFLKRKRTASISKIKMKITMEMTPQQITDLFVDNCNIRIELLWGGGKIVARAAIELGEITRGPKKRPEPKDGFVIRGAVIVKAEKYNTDFRDSDGNMFFIKPPSLYLNHGESYHVILFNEKSWRCLSEKIFFAYLERIKQEGQRPA